MKNLVLTITLFILAFPPVHAEKIKIKSAYKIGTAQEAVVKLNQKAMDENNVFVVPRGRRIYSRLNDNIFRSSFNLSSDTKTGDILTTQLMQDWQYKDKIVAPEGSLVRGVVTSTPSQNSVRVNFNTIIRPDNVEIKIISKPVEIRTNDNSSKGILISFGTEFTIQIINDVITKPY